MIKLNISRNKSVLDRWYTRAKVNAIKPKTKTKIYLCGAMQNVKGYGKAWRNKLEKVLLKNGYDVFNPASECKLYDEVKKYKKCLKSKTLLEDLKNWSLDIISQDLLELNTTDLVVCKWEMGVQSAGSAAELTLARLWNIPILIISDVKTEKDWLQLPVWLIGCCDYYASGFENITKHITEILEEKKNAK